MVEKIAKVCHEVNRVYCNSIGDYSQVIWDLAPQWQKDSAIKGVEAALVGATPEQIHESWVKHKESEGWVLGAVKSEELKTHPCMIPYDLLPKDQKTKDHLFLAVVEAMR